MYWSRSSHIGVWLLPSDSNFTHFTWGMLLKNGARVQSAAVSYRPFTTKHGTVIWPNRSTLLHPRSSFADLKWFQMREDCGRQSRLHAM
jgi:hypothetical protein